MKCRITEKAHSKGNERNENKDLNLIVNKKFKLAEKTGKHGMFFN